MVPGKLATRNSRRCLASHSRSAARDAGKSFQTSNAAPSTRALRATGQSMHPTATGRSATRIGRSEPRSPACSRVGSQQSHTDDDQRDADPPRARYPLLQEALGKDRDDDESDAADRESGADLDELQGARIDQCLQDEKRDSSADPQLLAIRRQRRALEEHLRDTLDDATQDDQRYPDRGRRHCRVALRDLLSWSVRLMNQTPANTNPMPSTLSVSTLSPRYSADRTKTRIRLRAVIGCE